MDKLCAFCQFKEASLMELIDHVKVNHNNQLDHPGLQLKCFDCDSVFFTGAEYLTCLKKHVNPFDVDNEDDVVCQDGPSFHPIEADDSTTTRGRKRKRQSKTDWELPEAEWKPYDEDLHYWKDRRSGDPVFPCPGYISFGSSSEDEVDVLEDEVNVLDLLNQVGGGPSLITDGNGSLLSLNRIKARVCTVCSSDKFLTGGAYIHHVRISHPDDFSQFINAQDGGGLEEEECEDFVIKKIASAHDNIIMSFKVNLEGKAYTDFSRFVSSVSKSLKRKLRSLLDEHVEFKGIRLRQFSVQFQMTSQYEEGQGKLLRSILHSFTTPLSQVKCDDEISDSIKFLSRYLDMRNDDFTLNGSGWRHALVKDFRFTVFRYKALVGGTMGDEKLPDLLRNKHGALINVTGKIGKGVDNKCFAHSILAHFEVKSLKKQSLTPDQMYKARAKVRNANHYSDMLKSDIVELKDEPTLDSIDFSGLSWPMKIRDFKIFQKNNPTLGFCILGYDREGEKSNKKKDKEGRGPNFPSDEFVYDSDDSDPGLNVEFHEGGMSQISTSSGTSATSQKHRRRMEIRSKIHPFYTTNYTTDVWIDLLFLFGKEGEEDHFVYIEDMYKLMGNVHGGNNKQLCRWCLHWFSNHRFNEHIEHCAKHGCQKTNMPNHELEFTNYQRTIPSAFTFFLDFESALMPIDQAYSSADPSLIKHTYHEPCGYAWACVDYNHKVVKRGKYCKTKNDPSINVAYRCLQELLDLAENFCLKQVKEWNKEAPTSMTGVPDWLDACLKDKRFDWSEHKCAICEKPFTKKIRGYESLSDVQVKQKENGVVKHHLHFPPYNFLGLAHNSCNLVAQIRKSFSVYCHNWTGYDSHFILMASKPELVEDVHMMGSSTEKITCFTVNKLLKFVDSTSFFGGSSLDGAVSALDPEDFDLFKDTFREIWAEQGIEYTEEKIERLLRKGAYPYTYMNSFDRFKETKLPPIEAFYNDLTKKPLESEVYENALQVWDSLGIKNLEEWHDLYVQADTLLLATCFVRNRKVMLESFNLDLTHYLSLPQFSLDACLKFTGFKVELVKDPDIYMYLENGVRGGLCTIGDMRAAKANNEFCDNHDKTKPTSSLLDLDKNNLYGHGLSSYVPVGKYRFLPDNEVKAIEQYGIHKHLDGIHDEGEEGEMIEVTISYPEDKHEYFNSYPPCPSKRNVNVDEVSPFQRDLADRFSVGNSAWKCPKMIACLQTKKVICHYRILKLWLKLGLVVEKVHRILRFAQADWMKPYIDYNTLMRSQAKSKVEINLRKFLNNSLFGKTLQDVRGRVNMVLINSPEKAIRFGKKPTLKHIKILSPDMSLAIMQKQSITLNSPLGIGVTVLEEAKRAMYEFWYGYVMKHFEGKANLLYSDTDSFMMRIEHDNIYDHMKAHSNEFDMSDYDPKNPTWAQYYDPTNKKTVNKMKDEIANGVMTEFCALRSKLYGFRFKMIDGNRATSNKGETRKAGGINRTGIEEHCAYERYLDTLENNVQSYATLKGIRAFDHQLYTVEMKKRCLNSFDNKRFFLDSVNSLALGHKDIKKHEYGKFFGYKKVEWNDVFEDNYERKLFVRLERNDMNTHIDYCVPPKKRKLE